MTFTVSSDERVIAINIAYDFNGCSGSRSFANLSLRTAPEVICVPGPCSGTVASYRSFNFLDGTVGSGARTSINGVFLPGNRAEDQAGFFDYPGCASAFSATWSAAKR